MVQFPFPAFHSEELDILMQMGIGNRKVSSLLSSILLVYLFVSRSCSAINIISPTQSITDGETLTSEGEVTELGFFSPGNSSNRYVGIWYMKIPDRKVVWVANRDKPLMDSSGVLTIGRDGNLVLLDGKQNIVWSTNVTVSSNSSIAQLLDDGNLVLNKTNSGDIIYLWQSFDYPSDTFLQNMKLGLNTKTGQKRFLTSWKSDDDPSPGNFILGIGHPQLPQVFVWNGSVPYWRSGEWNGSALIGVPTMDSIYLNGVQYLPDSQGGVYFSFSIYNNAYVLILSVGSSGTFKQLNWNEGGKQWTESWGAPVDQCDIYGKCGTFGTCNVLKSPICGCLQGFEPNFIEEWRKGDWTGGCVRRTQLQCEKNNTNLNEEKGDWFLKLEGFKLPDFSYYLNVFNASQCRDECLRNCSCLAYAFVGGINCMVWGGNLIDIQEFHVGGEELFLRLAHSEFGKKKLKTYIIVLPLIAGALTMSALASSVYWWKVKRRGKKKELLEIIDASKTIENCRDSPQANLLKDRIRGRDGTELPFFYYGTIETATNNFANKLGEGGFGPVYKGTLLDGQEIAVKKLSRSSGQGIVEFKNELMLISKLQHRNLVRLLGFCIEGEEKILLYEYMPHKSLDAFLFDPTRRVLLDWGKRMNIVDGIARGLLYLHRDSRLRVIHRDLKASNILLDEDMNPKISDFGTARIFSGKQTLANTNRVVGTYGYMSPEYAMEGIFSEKSDVFSFGVLLLEIVSSKRNTSFYHHEQALYLLGYAWRLWNEGKALELMDPSLVDSYSPLELMRCIHVGLLCVQEHAIDRPIMSAIVFMLGSETTLPTPKQPAFTLERMYMGSDLPSKISGLISINTATMTSVDGR